MPALAEHSGDGGIPLSLVSLNTVLFGHSGDGGILQAAEESHSVDDRTQQYSAHTQQVHTQQVHTQQYTRRQQDSRRWRLLSATDISGHRALTL